MSNPVLNLRTYNIKTLYKKSGSLKIIEYIGILSKSETIEILATSAGYLGKLLVVIFTFHILSKK